MTKLGWAILALIVIVCVGFGSMLTVGTVAPGQSSVAPPPRHRTLPEVVEGFRDRSAGRLVVPVAGVGRRAITDTWGDTRGGGTRQHHGTDIAAPGGTPVVAAATGVIEKLFASRLGGTTMYVRSQDRRWVYYYAHLSGYADGVREGMPVKAGQLIAYVGDTGDAGRGNFHLHFGLQHMAPGERWWQGQDVNPYPLLASGRLPG